MKLMTCQRKKKWVNRVSKSPAEKEQLILTSVEIEFICPLMESTRKAHTFKEEEAERIEEL